MTVFSYEELIHVLRVAVRGQGVIWEKRVMYGDDVNELREARLEMKKVASFVARESTKSRTFSEIRDDIECHDINTLLEKL